MNDLTFNQLTMTNEARAMEWQHGQPTDESWIEFASIELAGESGEVSDAVKKYLRHRKGMPGGVDKEASLIAIGEELADTIISADRLAKALGIDLPEAIRRKFNMTSEKHGFETRL